MIKYQKDNKIFDGYNHFTKEEDYSENMLMDFCVYKGKKNEMLTLKEAEKEVAVILFSGEVQIISENIKEVCCRKNVFDEGPFVLHVCKGKNIELKFLEESEIGIQKAKNDIEFESKLYTPLDCKNNIFGKEGMGGTAKRLVRDVFNYDTAPYSNMVLGEVITLPGKWSSYPPHSHIQPEIYYYKFDKPQGFGGAFVGENVFKIKNNSVLLIKGGETHPQVSAPGYAMYYCWMIRNLENNPWTTRENDKEHEWLLDEKAKIWNIDL